MQKKIAGYYISWLLIVRTFLSIKFTYKSIRRKYCELSAKTGLKRTFQTFASCQPSMHHQLEVSMTSLARSRMWKEMSNSTCLCNKYVIIQGNPRLGRCEHFSAFFTINSRCSLSGSSKNWLFPKKIGHPRCRLYDSLQWEWNKQYIYVG